MNENYWNRFTSERLERRRVLKAGAAFSLGAAGLGLLGCGSDDGDNDDAAGVPTSAAGEPQRGGRLGTISGSVSNYDVVINFQEGYNNSGTIAYDRLIGTRMDKRKYLLEAAESVEVAEPTRIVFKLKPNMVYHNIAPVNGRAVVGEDIAATQMYVKQLPNAENGSFQRTYISRMEAPDARTVIFHLSQPSAYLFSQIQLGNGTAQPIIPKEMLANLGGSPQIGSGPYQLADHTFNVRYLWKRFDKYRKTKDGGPYIDEREVLMLTDQVAIEAAFRSGQIHVWNLPASAVDRVTKELNNPNEFQSDRTLTTQQYKWEANCDPQFGKVWRDVRVREALYRLTNRQQFLDLVYRGNGVIPPGPLAASLERWQLDPKVSEPYYKEDPAAAKRLLDAASFPYDTEHAFVVSNSGTNPSGAEVWQQQLSRAGIKVRPNLVPFAEWIETVQQGRWDLGAQGGAGSDSPVRFLRKFHSDQQEAVSHMGLFDKDIDAMIEKSEQVTDEEENHKLVMQIQVEVLKRYGAFYNALTPNVTTFRSAKLQAWERDPSNPPLYQTQAWFAS